jgi:urease accessory protein
MNRMKFSPSRSFAAASAGVLGLLPSIASAHPGHYHPPGEEDEFDAFTAGVLHPATGLDHLMLALAAGWLIFSFPKVKAALPSAFLAALAIGAWTGRGLQGGAFLEIALSCTLLAAGAAILISRYLKAAPLAVALCAAGAIHGFAHGAETAAGVPFLPYATGFILGTGMLVAGGVLLHAAASRLRQPLVPRIAGAALLAAGTASLIHAI